MKKQFPINKAIPVIVAALAIGFATSVKAGQKPNIVFFLTDDQGYGDLGCFGAKDLKTPNIDKLCSQGMKFTDFHVYNRCSATRMSLMTGSFPHRVGGYGVIYRWNLAGIHSDEITTAELLRQGGYATGAVGKWHLGDWEMFNPVNHGFDEFYGMMELEERKKGIFRNKELVETLSLPGTHGNHSEKFLNAGIEFITSNKDKPFFLYYASPLPHSPWRPSDRFKGSSERGVFGDMIHDIDWQVGELMKTLDELGLKDNTLFVFASDNGPELNGKSHGSSGKLRDGKWSNFEGGIRTPCIMHWPDRIPAGTENHQITGIIDMLPTFCTIADVDIPTDRVIDGKNILPYMENRKVVEPIHDFFVIEGVCIRYGDWKLFVKKQDPGGNKKKWGGRTGVKAGALFNLKNDIEEQHDVSSQFPEKAQQLKQRMDAFMSKLEKNKRPIGKTPEYSPEKKRKE